MCDMLPGIASTKTQMRIYISYLLGERIGGLVT